MRRRRRAPDNHPGRIRANAKLFEHSICQFRSKYLVKTYLYNVKFAN